MIFIVKDSQNRIVGWNVYLFLGWENIDKKNIDNQELYLWRYNINEGA